MTRRFPVLISALRLMPMVASTSIRIPVAIEAPCLLIVEIERGSAADTEILKCLCAAADPSAGVNKVIHGVIEVAAWSAHVQPHDVVAVFQIVIDENVALGWRLRSLRPKADSQP